MSIMIPIERRQLLVLSPQICHQVALKKSHTPPSLYSNAGRMLVVSTLFLLTAARPPETSVNIAIDHGIKEKNITFRQDATTTTTAASTGEARHLPTAPTQAQTIERHHKQSLQHQPLSHQLFPHSSRRHLLDNHTGTDCGSKADPIALVALYIVGMLYTFLAIAIVCDEYFVPALELMAERFGLSNDVAGATLMAAGGSAPELFTSFIGTFQESSIGFGTIVGSAVFNVLFVIGMCAIFSKELLTLHWWPLARDCLCYAFALGILAVFFGGVSNRIIEWWEALILFLLYIAYVAFMVHNRKAHKWVLSRLGLPQEAETYGASPFKRDSTFRAGILRLIVEDNANPVDQASAGIVARVTGDVQETFNQLDSNGDGELDISELRELLERLGCNNDAVAVANLLEQSDTDLSGTISIDEFTTWYIRSEERLRAERLSTFRALDTNNSNSVGAEQLAELMRRLDVKFTDDDVAQAMDEIDANHDGQVTYEEFSSWFESSLFWQATTEEADSAADHAGGVNPCFPHEGSMRKKIYYCFVFPLILLFWLTLPDVSKPSRQGRWAYVTFIGSIMMIGVFSYFMVTWAEVVGATAGIPPVVMGLTFLAAGTSVPDLITSVIVARQGEGDMAVSSSIGSNIFDVLVGLPLPWLAFVAVHGRSVNVEADNLFVSVIVLIGMLVAVVASIMAAGWKMSLRLGLAMIFLYGVFLAQDLGRANFSCS
eukprot:m.119728 g.119728  ORF g.119728 m.119728 type:complete len:715 (-) comp28757_c0_seq3:23-2167(-)